MELEAAAEKRGDTPALGRPGKRRLADALATSHSSTNPSLASDGEAKVQLERWPVVGGPAASCRSTGKHHCRRRSPRARKVLVEKLSTAARRPPHHTGTRPDLRLVPLHIRVVQT
jgi:hypothetical protein